MTTGHAKRRYHLRMAVAMAIYIASLFVADWLIEDRGVTGIAAVMLASVPGLCVAAIFWILARLVIEESDEFLRLLYIRQIIIATGIALTGASVWGFLELYMLVPHIDAYWWPVIWCLGTGVGGIYNKLTMGTSGNCT